MFYDGKAPSKQGGLDACTHAHYVVLTSSRNGTAGSWFCDEYTAQRNGPGYQMTYMHQCWFKNATHRQQARTAQCTSCSGSTMTLIQSDVYAMVDMYLRGGTCKCDGDCVGGGAVDGNSSLQIVVIYTYSSPRSAAHTQTSDSVPTLKDVKRRPMKTVAIWHLEVDVVLVDDGDAAQAGVAEVHGHLVAVAVRVHYNDKFV